MTATIRALREAELRGGRPHLPHRVRHLPRPARPAHLRRRRRLDAHALRERPGGGLRRRDRRPPRRLQLRDDVGERRLLRPPLGPARALERGHREAAPRPDDGAPRRARLPAPGPVHVRAVDEARRALPALRLLAALPRRRHVAPDRRRRGGAGLDAPLRGRRRRAARRARAHRAPSTTASTSPPRWGASGRSASATRSSSSDGDRLAGLAVCHCGAGQRGRQRRLLREGRRRRARGRSRRALRAAARRRAPPSRPRAGCARSSPASTPASATPTGACWRAASAQSSRAS